MQRSVFQFLGFLAAICLLFATNSGVARAQSGALMAEDGVVIAEGLNGPQGVLVNEDGNVWVIDSGLGGTDEVPFYNTQAMAEVVAMSGESAQVVVISPDDQEVYANLPSLLMGMEALGGGRLAVLDGVLYATVGQGAGDPEWEGLPNFGGVVAIDEEGIAAFASTWDFERANNPDGTSLFDSHPYGLTAGPDGYLYVADSGSNDVLKIDPESGEISLFAVLEPLPGVFPNETRGGEMLADPVPTAIVFDEDGNAYVAYLSGAPFIPGSAGVVMITPDGEVSQYATGYTMLTDLRWGPDGEMYGVQFGMFTEDGPVPNAGSIVQINGDEEFDVVVEGLSFPTSIDFNEAGDAYVTINGLGEPGSGAVVLFAGLADGEPGVAPVPESAYGPPIPEDTGYLVEEISDGLYWVTDGGYQMMFLTTGEGVIVVDAPPSIGENILNAIADVTDEPITHVIYSHAHADHIGAAGIYPEDATIIAHEDTADALADSSADDPRREIPFGLFVGGGPVPLPTETFVDEYTLEVGDQVLELSYYGLNHSPGNIFVYAPEQEVLMLVDVIFPGWSPFFDLALAESTPGFIAAHDDVLDFDFETFIGGHLTRLGTREDVELQQEYILDIQANAAQALQTVDFMAIGQEVGFGNPWLLFGTYLDAVAEECAALTIPNWVETLGGVDINTASHCWKIMESLRLE